jgi:MFS family permease
LQIFLITLAVTLAVQIQASLVVFTPPILAPVAQSDVGMSAASVGLVTALIYLSSVPSALLSGSIIARLGAIRVSQLCVLFTGVGMILMVSGDAWLIAIGALTVGLGYGAVTPSSSTVLADQAPRNLRSLIFSVKQSGVPIGGAIAGALVPYLMQVYSWRFAGAVIGLIGVVVIISAEFIRKRVDSVSDRPISNGKQLNL